MDKGGVLVTGGLGYIGSHTVVELLNRNYQVIVIDNLVNSNIKILKQIELLTGKIIDFHKIDLLNKNELLTLFSSCKIDYVLHFAAYKSVNESLLYPLKYYNNNIVSLINLLSVMEMYNVENIIFSSSCTVYGIPNELPVTEQSPLKNAESVYGTTKIMNEKILLDLTKHTPNLFKTIMLRYFNPVGAHPSGQIGELPSNTPNNLFPIILQTIKGEREKIYIFGGDYNTADGTAIRDYIHVVDLAIAHVKAIEKFKDSFSCNIYNIGTGNGYSVLQIVQEFEKVLKQPIKYDIIDRRQGDIEKIWADSSLAYDELGWKANYNISNMVESSLLWVEKSKNFI